MAAIDTNHEMVVDTTSTDTEEGMEPQLICAICGAYEEEVYGGIPCLYDDEEETDEK